MTELVVAKSLHKNIESLGFTSGQTGIGKVGWKTKGLLIRFQGKMSQGDS